MSNLSSRLAATQSDNTESCNLLTPPLSPASSEDVPFVPAKGDKTSLSMKRRHQRKHASQHRRLDNRTCLSSDNLRPSSSAEESLPSRFRRSNSSPHLRRTQQNPVVQIPTGSKHPGVGLLDQRRRRWTLPTKAAPTNNVANNITVELKPLSSPKRIATEHLSPAMITLRRATTAKPESRRMSLTSFPEPKFERTQSELLKSFLRTMSAVRSWKNSVTSSDRFQQALSQPQSRSYSRSSQAHPASCDSAPVVCTQVDGVTSTISIPGQDPVDSPLRRCSTTFVTGGSVYEVVWDENISTNGSEGSDLRTDAQIPARRKSLAVGTLETQLFKAEEQHRRSSEVTETPGKKIATVAFLPQDSESFVGKIFPKLTKAAALQNLPRSKSSLKRDAYFTFASNMIDSPKERRGSNCQIEFFPPLRKPTATKFDKCSADSACILPDDHPYQCQRPLHRNHTCSGPVGSMMGVSNHMRRRSAGPVTKASRIRSNAFLPSRRNSANIEPTKKTTVEDETTPLLSAVGMLE